MRKKLVVWDQIYNFSSENERKIIEYRFRKYLEEKVNGFPSTKIIINKLRKYDNRFEIEILGPEEVFVSNLIKKEIGTIVNFDNIEEGKIYKGTIIDCGKVGFGIFVDCAIIKPKKDVFTAFSIFNLSKWFYALFMTIRFYYLYFSARARMSL